MTRAAKGRATLIRGGWLVSMNKTHDTYRGDLLFSAGEIVEIGRRVRAPRQATVVDADDAFVIPGLIQAHTHLCQSLFRGLADDLDLLDWLRRRIWPFERAHNTDSQRASAQVGLLEMQLAGTTSVLDMGTVRGHETVFEEAHRSGIRYWGGNCLMDRKVGAGPLYRSTGDSLRYSEGLIRTWHLRTPLIQYAVSPRFALSCTEDLLRAATKLSDQFELLFHTHASESPGEVRAVKRLTGLDNVDYLASLGCLTSRTVLAHGVHLSRKERNAIVRAHTGVCHCPSSNLKLASGFAPIAEYRRQGMKLALGADGAPCNNMMDPFMEMRLAALLQKPLAGPTVLPAREALAMATIEGAAVLGADRWVGSLEAGKRADVVVVGRGHPSLATVEDPYSALVYSCTGRDVRDVWVDGRAVVRGGRHVVYNPLTVSQVARRELAALRRRASRLLPR